MPNPETIQEQFGKKPDKSVISQRLNDFFSRRIQKYGSSAEGVDWRTAASQLERFDQLLKVVIQNESFSINDLGCGYGALYQHMLERDFRDFEYYGYDLCADMIERAKIELKGHRHAYLTLGSELQLKDYTVASGIFGQKLDFTDDEWREHVLETLESMAKSSRQGFAFNLKTIHSDTDRIYDQVFYADPCFFFEWCRRKFSRKVALLHDYEAYDFTIIVRKL